MTYQKSNLLKLIEFSRDSVEGKRDDERYMHQSWTLSAGPGVVPSAIIGGVIILGVAATRWSKLILAKVWSLFS